MEKGKVFYTLYNRGDAKERLEFITNSINGECTYWYACGMVDFAVRCGIINAKEYAELSKKIDFFKKKYLEANRATNRRIAILSFTTSVVISVAISIVLYMLKQL